MSSRYTVALIGLGRIGLTMMRDPLRPRPASHAEAILEHPLLGLASVCDTNPVALESLEDYGVDVQQIRTADHPQAALAANPDVVVIATPPSSHRALVEACAARASVRIIVVEKPMALTVADAEAMAEICRIASKHLIVNHSRAFDRPLMDAIIATAGTIHGAVVWYGGGLWNTGAHAIDLLHRVFGGPPTWVDVPRVWCDTTGLEDPTIPATLMWEKGRLAYLVAHGMIGWTRFDCHLWSESGVIELLDSGYQGMFFPAEASASFTGYRTLNYRRGGPLFPPEPRSFLAPLYEHLVAVLEDHVPARSTGEEGVSVTRTLAAIQKSSLHKNPVPWGR